MLEIKERIIILSASVIWKHEQKLFLSWKTWSILTYLLKEMIASYSTKWSLHGSWVKEPVIEEDSVLMMT